ncbi:uncharacterized protein LOC127283891 [Leptopilina boulardi]|uniref:uncharacterized protein LOC127283891 n=1 Tax=Leptopilina boulardi TaxID=63433 RepID=UPI0021F6337D|nr:uncharacterized protein LOC127283891 [Leptopilina boulardi]
MEYQQRKNKRKYRVHPLWQQRSVCGAHNTLIREMVMHDPAMFRNYLRMSTSTYENLLLKVGHKLQSCPTRTDVITPSEKLIVTLRYLATGESFTSLSRQFRMGIKTIQIFIPETLKALWTTLQPEVLVLPTTPDAWMTLINNFNEKWQFPNCYGAMDGKHVLMQGQPGTGSDYYNYKNFHSIVLLAMCNADYVFTMVDVRGKGRQSDGGILKNSAFFKALEEDRLNLPPPTPLYPNGPNMPVVYIADAAFENDLHCLTPYKGAKSGNLSKDKNIYNYRLSRARRTIENAFGILVAMWRIFHTPIMANLTVVQLIVLATVCLHNYIIKEEKSLPLDLRHYCSANISDQIRNVTDNSALQPLSIPQSTTAKKNLARYNKNHFKEYFMGPGKVSWQDRAAF